MEIKLIVAAIVIASWIIGALGGKKPPQRIQPPPLPPAPPPEPNASRPDAEPALGERVREARRRRAEAETAERERRRRDEAPIAAVVVEEPRRREPRRRQPIPPPPAPRTMATNEPAPLPADPGLPIAAAASVRRMAYPPAARLVRQLLKDRQSLRAAILLREVLDAPLCKRRGARNSMRNEG